MNQTIIRFHPRRWVISALLVGLLAFAAIASGAAASGAAALSFLVHGASQAGVSAVGSCIATTDAIDVDVSTSPDETIGYRLSFLNFYLPPGSTCTHGSVSIDGEPSLSLADNGDGSWTATVPGHRSVSFETIAAVFSDQT